MSILNNRRGTTLVMAILLLTLLVLAVASGFSRFSSDRRLTADRQAQVKALTVAESGLERYIAAVAATPPASHDSVIHGLANGIAYVSLRRIRDVVGTEPAVFLIRSRGVDTTARRYDARTGPAERTVAQYATWRVTQINVPGGWNSITGLTKNGGSGTLSGVDACGVNPAIAGVSVPTLTSGGQPGYSQSGGSSVPTGAPPVNYMGTVAAAAAAINVDWAGILNGNVVTPHYKIDATVSPNVGNWPTSTQMNAWPVTMVTGDYSIPSGGKGTLIVSGNLTISGSKQWDGIILVGGTLTSNGNNTVYGAVVSGLNVKLGIAVGVSDVGNGTKVYQYHSCDIVNAQNQLVGLQRIPNGWSDDYSSY